jgi:hypothetical protein
MKVSDVLTRRVRGFRVFDMAALVILLSLALLVYGFKTSAGRERTNISDVESEIHDETQQVRLLRAEVAHLESPDRLERLARPYAGQAPVAARQEIAPDALAEIAQTASTTQTARAPAANTVTQ